MPRPSRLLLLSGLSIAAALLVWQAVDPGASSPPSPSAPTLTSATPADLRSRLASAGRSEFAGLLAEATRIVDAAERNALIAEVSARWMATDRRGFLNHLDELEVEEGPSALAILLPGLREALTRLDEKSAASPLIAEFITRIAELMATEDPAAAVAWIESTQTGDRRDHALAVTMEALTAADPARAQELFATMRQPARRIEAARAIATALAASEPGRAIAWARDVKDLMERNLAMTDVLRLVAERSPDLAADGLIAFEEVLRVDSDRRIALYRDEYAAVTAKPTGGEEIELSTPENYAAAQTFENERLLSGPATEIARVLAAQDPQTAVAWVQSLGSKPLRERVLTGVLAGWAETAPEAAWFFAQNSAEVQPEAAGEVFTAWARHDPDRARAEIASINDSAWRNAAIAGTALGWLERDGADPVEIARWTDSLPSGAGRDLALNKTIDVLAERAPEEAWSRAMSIRDMTLRRDALTMAFATFLEENPELARSALARADLEQADQRALQRMLDGVTVSAP